MSGAEMTYQEWTFLDDIQADGNWDPLTLKAETAKLFSTPSPSQNKAFTYNCDSNEHGRTRNNLYTSREDLSQSHRSHSSKYSSQHSNCDGIHGSHVKPYCDEPNYHSFVVFVRTKQCAHTPVTLHVVHILPGVVLVLISEVSLFLIFLLSMTSLRMSEQYKNACHTFNK